MHVTLDWEVMFPSPYTTHKNTIQFMQYSITNYEISLPTSTAVAGVGLLPLFLCAFVCYSARYLKNDAAKITKLDIGMFHQESRKPIY